MKQFSNRYMLLYSLAIVAVSAVVLTVTAVTLKPRELQNRQTEQRQMVLKAIGVETSRNEAESLYKKYITESEYNNAPLYEFEKEGQKGLILPLHGNGLWGPIWGYLAIDGQRHVVGAVFDHKGETPGLGGEIATEKFARQFVGKRVTDDQGNIKAIRLKKNADRQNPYEVDAISGGTMTSNGVNEMIENELEKYKGRISDL